MPASRFIPPMLLLPTERLPEGAGWSYELKLDGYRALAIKSGGKVALRSRNNKDFNSHYPAIVTALGAMPDETVIDGEVVALDPDGRPSFNLLQNAAAGAALVYYVFDVLVLGGRDVMDQPLATRRKLLAQHALSKLNDPIRESPVLDAALSDLITSVRAQRLEGLVAKRLDSRYEPGRRSGAWQKMRINQGQEFVIGGYTLGGIAFACHVFGCMEGGAYSLPVLDLRDERDRYALLRFLNSWGCRQFAKAHHHNAATEIPTC